MAQLLFAESLAMLLIFVVGAVVGVVPTSIILFRQRRRQNSVLPTGNASVSDDALAHGAVLRAITNGLSSPVACIGRDRKYLFANEAYVRWFTTESQTLEGKSIEDVLGSACLTKTHDSVQRAFMGETVSFEGEVSCFNGTAQRMVFATFSPVYGENGLIESVAALISDRTDYRASYEALQKSEAEFRNIYELAAVGNVEVDQVTRKIVRANQKFCSMVGYSLEELLQMRIEDVTYLEDRPRDKAVIAERQAVNQSDFSFEKRYVRKDGKIIWVLVMGILVHDSDGLLRRGIATVQDITERKSAEAAREQSLQRESEARAQLQLEKEKLLSFISQAPAAIAIYRGDNYVIDMANSVYFEKTGRSEDIQGRPYAEVFPELVEQGALEALGSVYQTGQVWSATEVPLAVRLANGDVKEAYLNSILQPYRNTNGKIEGIINLSLDVTEQVLAKKKEEEAERRLSLALSTSNMGVWEWDLTTGALYWDDRTKDLFGVAHDQFQNQIGDFDKRVHPADRERVHASIEDSIRNKTEFLEEYRALWPDGTTPWIFARGSALYDSSGKPLKLVGVVMDVTGKKQSEEELEEAKLKAEEASRAKSAFLANMSHEIRTPLGAMLGFAQLMMEDANASEEQKRTLKTILRNGDQLYRIINEVLDISKVEANKFDIENIRFDLDEVIRDVTSLLSVKAQEKGIAFEVRSEGPLPESIVSDPTRFRQILINVIGNAIKFTEKGKVVITFRLKQNETGGQGNLASPLLEVEIEDTGLGIPEDKRDLLFQPFAQADSATSRKFGGTGLGLYLSRQFAQALGGDLVLKGCVVNEGCTFVFTVDAGPLEKKPLLHLQMGTNQHVVKGDFKVVPLERIDDIRVLVVDDSDDNLQLTDRFLSAAGASVRTALGAKKAFEILQQDDVEVVLMDIQMPEMDGYQAVRHLRRSGYLKPVVALTAHAMKGERERSLQAGFDGYLVKPINRSALIKEVKSQASRSSSFKRDSMSLV